MKLNLYAVVDLCADSVVRFAFGNNDSSFVRDNLPSDIYNADTRRGLPLRDLCYRHIGIIDTETFVVEPVELRNVDIELSYQFKIENPVEKVENFDKEA